MSTFRDLAVACPRCGVETRRSLVVSLSAPRVPAMVDAILEDRFQRFECPACAAPQVCDGPFIYVDMERIDGQQQWIGVFPRTWEGRWRALESEPVGAFQRSVVENAPRFVQQSAPEFVVRAVFGLDALRDKLVCLGAGLDDATLEVLKLDLLRGDHGLVFHPRGRRR